jgi:hypothetical protein
MEARHVQSEDNRSPRFAANDAGEARCADLGTISSPSLPTCLTLLAFRLIMVRRLLCDHALLMLQWRGRSSLLPYSRILFFAIFGICRTRSMLKKNHPLAAQPYYYASSSEWFFGIYRTILMSIYPDNHSKCFQTQSVWKHRLCFIKFCVRKQAKYVGQYGVIYYDSLVAYYLCSLPCSVLLFVNSTELCSTRVPAAAILNLSIFLA